MAQVNPRVHLSPQEPRCLVLAGILTFEDSPDIRQLSETLLDAGCAPLRVDASDLKFMDSSGLSAMIYAVRKAERHQTHVCLIGAHDQLQRLLRVTNLEPLFRLDAPCEVPPPRPPHSPLVSTVDQVYIDLPCNASSLGLARDRIGRLMDGRGFTSEESDDIYLALGESVANALRHACPHAPPGSGIHLFAACDAEGLTIEVTDHGPPFDETSVPDPDVTRLQDGGMGIFFMKKVMDEVNYQHNPDGNTVRMLKRLYSSNESETAS